MEKFYNSKFGKGIRDSTNREGLYTEDRTGMNDVDYNKHLVKQG